MSNELNDIPNDRMVYYCESENYYGEDIARDFEEMLSFFAQPQWQEHKQVIDNINHTIEINGDLYKLCKEPIIQRGRHVGQKSCLIHKAIVNAPFTKDLIYKRLDEERIHFVNDDAKNDYSSKLLRNNVQLHKFTELYRTDLSIIKDILCYSLLQGYQVNQNILDVTRFEYPPSLTSSLRNFLVDELFTKNINLYIASKLLFNNPAIIDYLFSNGIVFKLTMEHREQNDIRPEYRVLQPEVLDLDEDPEFDDEEEEVQQDVGF